MHVKITRVTTQITVLLQHPDSTLLALRDFFPQSCFGANWDTCYYCGFYYCKQQRRNGVIPSNGLLLTKPG